MPVPLPRSLSEAWRRATAPVATPAHAPATLALSAGPSGVLPGERRAQPSRMAQIAGATGTDVRHPILRLTSGASDALSHEIQMAVLGAMLQFWPTLAAAIANRRTFEGGYRIVSKDEGLQRDLVAWSQQVPVGPLAGAASQRGLGVYLDQMAVGADGFGMSVGGPAIGEDGRTIERLVVAPAPSIYLKLGEASGLYETWQTQRTGPVRIDTLPHVQTLAFSDTHTGGWPHALAYAMTQSAEVMLRMYNAVSQAWLRYGDPPMLHTIEYDSATELQADDMVDVTLADGTVVQAPYEIVAFRDTVLTIMNAKREGGSGDAFAAVTGGKFNSQALGDLQSSLVTLFADISSQFDGHIVAKSNTPSWMYPHVKRASDGLGGKLSTNELIVASVDARRRSARLLRLARQVLDLQLASTGGARFVGKYVLEPGTISIFDDMVEAEAREMRAKADEVVIQNAGQLYDDKGKRRFADEAARYLDERGVLPAPSPRQP